MIPLSPFQICGPLRPNPILLTCDHASNCIHAPDQAAPSDLPWLQTHWAFDPGAAFLTRSLCDRLQLPAVLSTFSRLLADPNRSPEAHDWISQTIEGGAHTLSFNQNLQDEDRTRRLLSLYAPYHLAVDAHIEHLKPSILLGVHTFTPLYLGSVRPMQACVMFDQTCQAEGERFAKTLNDQGLQTALNDPYSGIKGPFHSMTRHGKPRGLTYLQLEIRQDLFLDPLAALHVAACVARAVQACFQS